MALDPKDIMTTIFARYGYEPSFEVRMVHIPTGQCARVAGGPLEKAREECLVRLEALVKE